MFLVFVTFISTVLAIVFSAIADNLKEENIILTQRLNRERHLSAQLIEANDMLVEEKITPEILADYSTRNKLLVAAASKTRSIDEVPAKRKNKRTAK